MQEISSVLIEARKAKGLDLEQVVRDTNISRVFLEGLENDNYADFPAETYVLGFLRNYATYLGLDAEYIVKLYKQTMLQESDLPQEAMLIKKPIKKGLILKILLVVLVVAGLGVGVFFIFNHFFSGSNQPSETDVGATNITTPATIITENMPQHYELSDGYNEKRMFINDTFSVMLNETTHTFKIASLGSELELETEKHGTQLIKLADSVRLDLNEDTVTDIEVRVADMEKDEKKGALLIVTTGASVSSPQTDVDIASTNQSYTTIFEGASAYPVTMNITFRNYCFFRYEIDRGATSYNRNENYYQRNAVLSIKADNGFRIWASNGNALKIELVGAGRTVELDLTKPGEVIVQDIKWIREDNRYKFVVMNID